MSITLHTTLGDIKLELFTTQCPVATRNFLGLCAAGKYNNTKFHRSFPGAFIQGGDTLNLGGKGGESIYDNKPFEDEIVSGLLHSKRGIVAFANKNGQSNTNLSQFYILFQPQPQLNGLNTVFGHMIDGLDVLDSIEAIATDKKHRPVEDIVITDVTIHSNPFAQTDE